jgi:hypothetical protein
VLVAETHASDAAVSREEQDRFALRSHQRAVAAIDAGRFDEEIVAMPAPGVQDAGGSVRRDDGPRRDTSLEALARLRPAFHVHGTVTAGNSSQTSDGAAAVVVMAAERAPELGLLPLARFVTFATAGVAPERFGIGPVPAVHKALKQAGLSLEKGPLARAAWLDLGGTGARLLLVLHHLAVDGVSWRVLHEDIERACIDLLAGREPALGAKTTSFILPRHRSACLQALTFLKNRCNCCGAISCTVLRRASSAT